MTDDANTTGAARPGTAGETAEQPLDAAATSGRRQQLLREHAEQRRLRDHAALGSEQFRAAAMRIADIEVEIARIERAAGIG